MAFRRQCESQCSLSIPGIEPVLTVGILTKIDQLERFEDQAKLAKYTGPYLKWKQSGSWESEQTLITHTGNHYLHLTLLKLPTR